MERGRREAVDTGCSHAPSREKGIAYNSLPESFHDCDLRKGTSSSAGVS